jgi:hypothetical protein
VTGQSLDGARATSQVIILRFLADIEPQWAAEQYALFRRSYVVRRLGLPVVREYPPGRQGSGDVDSGPLILDASMSATTLMLGTARLYGDAALAAALDHSGEALGLPLTFAGRKRYAFGLLPIGDAFLAWSKSATPWYGPVLPAAHTPLLPPTWRLPFQLVSLLLGAPFALLTLRQKRRPVKR